MSSSANRIRIHCLLLAATLPLAGCWTTTTLDTARNPPPLEAQDRWQLLQQMQGDDSPKYSVFDDAAYYHNVDSRRVDCPYATATAPKATRKWFWDIFMPIPIENDAVVTCADGSQLKFWENRKAAAQLRARRWYTLAHMPTAADSLPEFTKFAANWRSSQQTVATDAVRPYKIAAESAIRDQQWKTAAEEYRKGVAAVPAWAQGHFNLALLLAEMHLYEFAGVEMQKYLLLMPDAANAQQAQDKLYEWQAARTRVPVAGK